MTRWHLLVPTEMWYYAIFWCSVHQNLQFPHSLILFKVTAPCVLSLPFYPMHPSALEARKLSRRRGPPSVGLKLQIRFAGARLSPNFPPERHTAISWALHGRWEGVSSRNSPQQLCNCIGIPFGRYLNATWARGPQGSREYHPFPTTLSTKKIERKSGWENAPCPFDSVPFMTSLSLFSLLLLFEDLYFVGL